MSSIKGTQSPETIFTALSVIKTTCKEFFNKDKNNPCEYCPIAINNSICKLKDDEIPAKWNLVKYNSWKAFK